MLFASQPSLSVQFIGTDIQGLPPWQEPEELLPFLEIKIRKLKWMSTRD